MRIGAGGGLLLGLAMQCDTAEMCAGAIGAIGALTGLAAGGLVDMAQKSQRPIYAAPGSTAAFQLRIVPVISRRQKGALVSIDF